MKSGRTGIKTRSTNLSTMFWNTSSNLSISSDLTHAVESPSITANTYAEHPETWRIGTNELVGENSFALSASLDKLLHGEWKHTTLPDRWDGRTAERIVQTLLNGNNS